MSDYKPGLHLLCTFNCEEKYLRDLAFCQSLFDRIIEDLDLTSVGQAYHSFPGAGYTGVICLTG